jgi:hypothetical protein
VGGFLEEVVSILRGKMPEDAMMLARKQRDTLLAKVTSAVLLPLTATATAAFTAAQCMQVTPNSIKFIVTYLIQHMQVMINCIKFIDLMQSLINTATATFTFGILPLPWPITYARLEYSRSW